MSIRRLRDCNGGTECRSGLDSIADEDVFRARLARLAALTPADKRRKWSELNRRENVMADDHAWYNRHCDAQRLASAADARAEEE